MGAIYTILAYTNPFSVFQTIVSKIILSILMVKIAFFIKDKKDWMISVLTFYIVSFLFAGCTLMYSLLLETSKFQNGVWEMNFSFFTVTSAGLLGIMLWKTVLYCLKKKMEKNIYEMVIIFQEKEIKVKAFFDTGNGLKDPITNQEVIILEKESFESLVGITEKELWKKEYEKLDMIRMIPFQSLGKQNGILFVIQANKVYFPEEELEKENVLIGKYEGKLSRKKEYQALIGPGIFERRIKNDRFIRDFKKSS